MLPRSFNQNDFNDFVLDSGVIGFYPEPQELRCHRKSCFYVKWGEVAGDTALTDKTANHIINFTRYLGLSPDCFYGIPETATPIGIITQYKWANKSINYDAGGYPLPMGRGKPKEHGVAKSRYFVGVPRGNTIIIFDTATTGGSLFESIDRIKETEAKIMAAFCLTDRMQLTDDGLSVKKAVENRCIPYHIMSKATELLPEAYRRQNPGEHIARAIEEEYEKYGIEKLKLL